MLGAAGGLRPLAGRAPRRHARPGRALQAEGRGWMDFTERCRLDIQQVRSRSTTPNARLLGATVRSIFDTRGVLRWISRLSARGWPGAGGRAGSAGGAWRRYGEDGKPRRALHRDRSLCRAGRVGHERRPARHLGGACRRTASLVPTVVGVLNNRALLCRAATDADVTLTPPTCSTRARSRAAL